MPPFADPAMGEYMPQAAVPKIGARGGRGSADLFATLPVERARIVGAPMSGSSRPSSNG